MQFFPRFSVIHKIHGAISRLDPDSPHVRLKLRIVALPLDVRLFVLLAQSCLSETGMNSLDFNRKISDRTRRRHLVGSGTRQDET